MSIQPSDLHQKCDALHRRWRTYVASPGFEPFVEFAVCISSFSEFLHGKGLSGLHQTAHQLEQRVLALFDDADRYPYHMQPLKH